ncbi:MAG: CDP-alcohol phosphatidyltransferase family protein, partial [Calditrichaeota bacterium]
SNFLSKRLVKTSLTPNQLSFLNFLFGLGAAALVAFGKPLYTILGGIVFQLTSIFDGCDGEVAILKMKDSKKGAFFDTIMDYATYVAFITGVTVGAYRVTHNPLVPFLSIADIALLLIAVYFAFRVLARKSGSMKDFAMAVDRVRKDKHQLWYVRAFSYLNDLGRRDLFSFATMLVLLLGNIVAYYWIMISAVFLMGMGISTIALFGIPQKLIKKVQPKPARFYLRDEVPAAEEVH